MILNRILANLVFSPEYLSARTESTTITNRFRLGTDELGFDSESEQPAAASSQQQPAATRNNPGICVYTNFWQSVFTDLIAQLVRAWS